MESVGLPHSLISRFINFKTAVILALFEKVGVLILLFMANGSGSAKRPDASLTSFIGILSIPGAFLEFRYFRMVLSSVVIIGPILEPHLEEGIEIERHCKLCFCGFLQY